MVPRPASTDIRARTPFGPVCLVGLACLVAVLGALLVSPAPAPAAELRAGAGRADVTPQTGYFLMGWVRSDSRGLGQHTRLFSRALVLKRGGEKVALVATDLGSLPNGLVVDIAERLEDEGFSQRDLVFSASHTHGAPAGYFNYPAFNTIAPTKDTPAEFRIGDPADPKLYTFLARQLARSIKRADGDLGAARAGWGRERILGLTDNRSIEAHLANHGIIRDFGDGHVHLDPQGYEHTIDPEVNVLRVDKERDGRSVPIGMWSTFSNHGTVNKPTFQFYNADHHGATTRVVERKLRRIGDVPGGQEVVNAYGNTDEGDVSSGLDREGPAAAEKVGRRQAGAMLDAWREAGGDLERRPELARRWTRSCFCGRQTEAGPVDENAVVGVPFLTGSEENRGPLFDITGVPFEGVRSPVGAGAQGHKLPAVSDAGTSSFPTAVPLTTMRVGDRVIATIPGEMTAEMGRRVRRAVLDASGSDVSRVVLSGLANDFIQYFTTPQEYERQHYEGGSTLFGRAASVFVQERLSDLADRMADGDPAPLPDPFDARNGVQDDASPYGRGSNRGDELSQKPREARRLKRARFTWEGGARGLDRPLEDPFVSVERRAGSDWRREADDLGLQILWSVRDRDEEDETARYRARWEAPRDAPAGRYRFVVSANRYRLASDSFRLRHSHELDPRLVSNEGGKAVVALDYPRPVPEKDFTHRPRSADGGQVVFTDEDGDEVVAREGRGSKFVVEGRPGERLELRRHDARDEYGNRNGSKLSFEL